MDLRHIVRFCRYFFMVAKKSYLKIRSVNIFCFCNLQASEDNKLKYFVVRDIICKNHKRHKMTIFDAVLHTKFIRGENMHYTYRTQGTCAREISFDINDGIITNVNFFGGCNGNLKGISILVDGMSVDEIEQKLKDVKCGMKNTSCPAQLAKAVRTACQQLCNE